MMDIAEDGAQAIKKARNNFFMTFILMDVDHLDKSGTETTKIIQPFSYPKKAKVPFVAVAKHADTQECPDTGIRGVLSKPIQQPNCSLCFGDLFSMTCIRTMVVFLTTASKIYKRKTKYLYVAH